MQSAGFLASSSLLTAPIHLAQDRAHRSTHGPITVRFPTMKPQILLNAGLVLHICRNGPHRAWSALARVAHRFFESSGEMSADPLVELVHCDARAAARFIKVVMSIASFFSVVAAICCLVFLAFMWGDCHHCDRPLRLWLLVLSVMQLLQAPIRVVFLSRIKNAEAANCIEACVVSFTSSPAWHLSLALSLITYAWLVLGTVWVLNITDCSRCPGMVRLTVGIITQCGLRILISAALFRCLFNAPDQASGQSKSELQAADPCLVAKLPVTHFLACAAGSEDESCAVCLSEYAKGDQIRHLPCKHYFHQRCADQWFRYSKRCPLCMAAVDAPQGLRCRFLQH